MKAVITWTKTEAKLRSRLDTEHKAAPSHDETRHKEIQRRQGHKSHQAEAIVPSQSFSVLEALFVFQLQNHLA